VKLIPDNAWEIPDKQTHSGNPFRAITAMDIAHLNNLHYTSSIRHFAAYEFYMVNPLKEIVMQTFSWMRFYETTIVLSKEFESIRLDFAVSFKWAGNEQDKIIQFRLRTQGLNDTVIKESIKSVTFVYSSGGEQDPERITLISHEIKAKTDVSRVQALTVDVYTTNAPNFRLLLKGVHLAEIPLAEI